MNKSKHKVKLLFITEKLPIHAFTRNNIPTENNEFYSLKVPNSHIVKNCYFLNNKSDLLIKLYLLI